MRARRVPIAPIVIACCALLAACGSSAPAGGSTPTAATGAIPPTARSARSPLRDWPEFGLTPQSSNAGEGSTGITAANLSRLRAASVAVGGTVDSSPIYLHGASVAGGVHDVVLVTTTYGKTVAV